MSSVTPDRDLAALVETAVGQGYVVIVRKNGHLKWVAPNGYVYFSARTPSDRRALKNIRAALVRHGALIVAS